MTTGRIDYSPDYKSRVNASLRNGKSVPEAVQLAHPDVERARLRDALIEAAKKWGAERLRIFTAAYPAKEQVRLADAADVELYAAISALAKFEAQEQ